MANSHNVFKLNPVPYDVQVQHLVQQCHYDLAMQICVSDIVNRCMYCRVHFNVCVYLYVDVNDRIVVQPYNICEW